MPYKKEIAICKQKVRFANSAAAGAALDRINPGRKSGKPLRVYKCPVCSGYHLTSQRLKGPGGQLSNALFYLVLLAAVLVLYLISRNSM